MPTTLGSAGQVDNAQYNSNFQIYTMAIFRFDYFGHLLFLCVCWAASVGYAQTVPERPPLVNVPGEVAHRPTDKRNSMIAAVMLVKQDPKKYQIHVFDLIKGDVYCDIQSITMDGATGRVEIHFNYRGQTSFTLAPISTGSFIGTGSYNISLPVLGISEVKVNLTFSEDGTARGQWRNMGYEGAFDITKK